MSEEAVLNKVQIALENDAEVFVSAIEQCESTLGKAARHFQGMHNITTQLDEAADHHAKARTETAALLGQLSQLDGVVARYEALARELDEYSRELDVKTKRIYQ